MNIRLYYNNGACVEIPDIDLRMPLPEVIVTDMHGGNMHFKYKSKLMKPGGEEIEHASYEQVIPFLIAYGAPNGGD